MTEAIRIMTTKSKAAKIVDLSAYKQKLYDSQEVKLIDFVPKEQDLVSFLHVLRFLQLKTLSEQVEIESNADGITFSLTEFESASDSEEDDTIEYKTLSHKTFVPFPFMLMDVDPSELTIHESGQNTIEVFANALASMLSSLEIPVVNQREV